MAPKKPHLFETVDKALPFILSEGLAKISYPNGEVFYNPVQHFNRDLSISVIRTFLRTNPKITEPKIFEGLSATGLRSIRYAKEIPGLSTVFANDLDSKACELIKANVEANEVQNLVKPNQGDANSAMFVLKSLGNSFSVIDLDPYGSAAPFIDSAVQNISNGGLLCITCTDMAVLCASYPETCFAKYSSIPIKGDVTHEGALRIVLSAIEASATRHKKHIKPLLTLSIDFYMRTFVQVFDSAAGSKTASSLKSYFSKCVSCGTLKEQPIVRTTQKGNSTVYYPSHVAIAPSCSLCNAKTILTGPFWNSSIHDGQFLGDLLKDLDGYELDTKTRILGMVSVAKEELDTPFFYSVPEMASFLKCTTPPLNAVQSAIVNAGYEVSISHTFASAIKTNAPAEFIWDIFREWIKTNPVKPESVAGTPAEVVLKIPQTHSVDFTKNEKAKAASKALGLVRFQENPTRNWGPLPRAK